MVESSDLGHLKATNQRAELCKTDLGSRIHRSYLPGCQRLDRSECSDIQHLHDL